MYVSYEKNTYTMDKTHYLIYPMNNKTQRMLYIFHTEITVIKHKTYQLF